ncbi:MAG: RNA-binding protein [Pseudomonadota bacterium]
MFVGNLPTDATKEAVQDLFSEFGTVRSIELATDIFTGKCKGFGFIEMEGHEARASIAGLNGKTFGGRPIKVRFKDDRGRRRRR